MIYASNEYFNGLNNSTMKNVFLLAMTICATGIVNAQQLSKEAQIASAVAVAPKDLRDGATVLGYNQEGKLTTLRVGSGVLVCLADNPDKKGFSVACYHKDLEPFMARGRKLKSEGKNQGEIFEIRAEEVKQGNLKMPDSPTTLHLLSGRDATFNTATGKVENANYRYVVYIPYATAKTTGLPLKPVTNGGPWLMNPGTHKAHIMISTPNKN